MCGRGRPTHEPHHVGHGHCAAERSLVTTAFAVFQRLAVQAPQAEVVQGGDVFALIVPRTEDPVSFAFHL